MQVVATGCPRAIRGNRINTMPKNVFFRPQRMRHERMAIEERLVMDERMRIIRNSNTARTLYV